MASQIYLSKAPSVVVPECSLFTHNLAKNGSRIGPWEGSDTAFIDAATGTQLTRNFVYDSALSVAHGLRNLPHLPLNRGDTVMVYSPNSVAFPIIFYGIVAAGMRATLANSAYTAPEIEHQFKDSGAKLIFSTEEGLPTVFETLNMLGFSASEAQTRVVLIDRGLAWAGGPHEANSKTVSHLTSLSGLLRGDRLAQEEKFDGALSNETVLLCYSSGTTGKPKGVETTHKNLLALIAMLPAWFPKKRSEDAMLGILPLYHIYGAHKLMMFPLNFGMPVVLMTRFEPVQFCQNIEKYRITHSLIVPPVMVILTRHPAVEQYNLETLRILVSGAAPLGDLLVKDVLTRLLSLRKDVNKNSLAILQGYGLTETSPTTHMLPEQDTKRKIGSIGLLLPNLECRLVADSENGEKDAADGEPGEIWVRGPTVMKGYLNNVTATKNSITPDGWFQTGDIAIKDKDDYFYVVDRKKELIKYKGFQVPPAELESVLLSHPDIADAAVIGVYSEKQATELPRAYLVHADPSAVADEAGKAKFSQSVSNWIQTKVARHKYLRGGVFVIDAIPKSAAGKILRRQLRDRVKEDGSPDTLPHAKL